jgi:hypothetical protein
VATNRKAPEPKPLEALDALIPKLSHAQLYEAAVRVFEEAGERAATYSDTIYYVVNVGGNDDDEERRGDLPIDIVNEALVFVADFYDLLGSFCKNERAKHVSNRFWCAEKDIQSLREDVAAVRGV